MSRVLYDPPRPRGALSRWRRRWGSRKNPLPSSTTDLTPADWKVIRLALEDRERTSIERASWPAAEAAHSVRAKVEDR